MRNPLPNFFRKYLLENSNFYLEKDQSFRAFTKTSLAGNGSTNFLIENPSGSEKKVFLNGLEYLTTQDIDVTITKNVDFSNGSQVGIKSLNIGGSNSSKLNAFSDVSFSNGSVEFEDIVRAAGATPNDPATSTGLTDLVVLSEENTNLVVDVNDVSGKSSTVIIRARWVEI